MFSISSWASHSFLSTGLQEFGWVPPARCTSQFPLHLKTCVLLEISPSGAVSELQDFSVDFSRIYFKPLFQKHQGSKNRQSQASDLNAYIVYITHVQWRENAIYF